MLHQQVKPRKGKNSLGGAAYVLWKCTGTLERPHERGATGRWKRNVWWREVCVWRETQQGTFLVYFAAIDITTNSRLVVFLPYMAQPLTKTTVKVPATTATIFSYHKTNGTLYFNTGTGGGGAKRQKAAWSLMTSKGLGPAQVQPPPNFCPLLIPSPLIGLIEDKLFEMDAQ